MHVLGISCYYHDSAAALIQDGLLVAAAEEERFSRIKHDNGFPHHAIDFCLQQAGIVPEDLDYVVFYEKPLLKFERILLTALATFPKSFGTFREASIAWLNEKLWVKGTILDKLNLPPDRLLFVEHHLSHAASAFFCSPYKESAILTVDGVGEWTTASIGSGHTYWDSDRDPDSRHSAIDLVREIKFPHSLGLLYSAFTAFLGFRVNEGEYKVMGMAPYGEPRYLDLIDKVFRVRDDGSFQLDLDYFCFHHSTRRTFNDKFVRLFGQPRPPESDFYTLTTHPDRAYPQWDDSVARQNQYYADVAASIQRLTEETLLKMARHAYEMTGSENLCMAGGVALNSVANGRILRETPFKRVYVQPAAGDSGGALGAALYAYHVVLGKPRQFVMEHAYWGQSHSPDAARQAVRETGFHCEEVDDIEKRATLLVEDLLAGKVVSLCQNRFEWGPRALGNRSILADPRRPEMKEIVNRKIKFREPFRPFAPAVLEEKIADVFEGIDDPDGNYPLRYMLAVYGIRPSQQDRIPAVCHGGTGRLQAVRSQWNPLYHRVLQLFEEATGVPVVLNTSFNLRGDPIANTPEQALDCFGRSGIDTLYMDGFVVRK